MRFILEQELLDRCHILNDKIKDIYSKTLCLSKKLEEFPEKAYQINRATRKLEGQMREVEADLEKCECK